MNILVIEDDKLLSDLISQKLSKEKFEVRVVVDAQDGLKAVEEKKPDLILLDLILPGWDGFEFLTRLRSNPKAASIPVIVLTGANNKEYIDRAMSLGVVDFLVKADFSLSGIVDKIKDAFRSKN